ncbi:MAG: hypothetical protein R3A47_11315 [Polyangiales bacterium]
MNPTLGKNITLFVTVSAIVLVAIAALWGGMSMGIAAVAGASIALGNWFAIRWIATNISSGNLGNRSAAVALLTTKLVLLATFCWLLLSRFELDPIGFALGLGALVFGVFFGSMTSADSVLNDGGVDAAR